MSKAQQQVQEAIDRMVESGSERGLQVAAYRNGEQVIDAVAGVADPETGRTMANDTPIYVFSVVKAAASTIAHRLVEQGGSATTPRSSSCGPSSAPTARRA